MPAELGALNVAALLPTYLSVLHLGVFTGLGRNVPIELGAGRSEVAERLVEASRAFSKVVAAGGWLIVVAIGLRGYVKSGMDNTTVSIFLTSFVLLALGVTSHVDTELRARQRFAALGKILIYTNLLTLVSALLIPWLGIRGAWVRIVVCSLGSLALRLGPGMYPLHGGFALKQTLQLARDGIPLLLSATMFGFVMAADRTLVAVFMTKEDLGNFALSGILVNSMQFIPQSVSLVLLSKMGEVYGKRRRVSDLRRLLKINLAFNVLTVVPVSICLYFGVEPLVKHVFPKYVGGIGAAKIACISSMFWIYLGAGSVIAVANRMTPYLLVMVGGLASIWLLGPWAISGGLGIEGASLARLCGTAIICAFTIGYSWYLTGERRGAS